MYDDKDILNLTEAALFSRMLLSRTFAVGDNVCQTGKKCKERIFVLLGANTMKGEKLLLLTASCCGQAQKSTIVPDSKTADGSNLLS